MINARRTIYREKFQSSARGYERAQYKQRSNNTYIYVYITRVLFATAIIFGRMYTVGVYVIYCTRAVIVSSMAAVYAINKSFLCRCPRAK